jgi:hypothetical protein
VPATPAPLADTGTLAQALALLGTVADAGDAPPELAALHLTRTLVAAAEQQAVAAEHAASKAAAGACPTATTSPAIRAPTTWPPPRPPSPCWR